MSKVPSEVLQGFTDLADYSAAKRASGVCLIVESVMSIEDKERRNAVIAYCLKRLVKGLSSSRQAARLGFAVALAEFIRRIDTVTVEDVTKLMDAILHIDSSGGGKLNALGFTMGLLALVETRDIVESNDPLLPFLTRHVLAINKKFGSSNFFFLQPLVSILDKCTKDAFSHCWYPSVEKFCRSSDEATFMDSLCLLAAVKLRFPKIAQSKIPLCRDEALLGKENLIRLSHLLKKSYSGSSIVHPCVQALLKAALQCGRFRQLWDVVMSDFIIKLIKDLNFKDAFEIVNSVIEYEAAAVDDVEALLTPEYFTCLLTSTAENPAMENDKLESARSSLALHMGKVQECLLRLSSAPMLNILFDALLASGSSLGQKTRLRLLEKCTHNVDHKIVGELFKKVVEQFKGEISEADIVLLTKLIVRFFKNDDGGKLRVKIMKFLIRRTFSVVDRNGQNAPTSMVLKEKLASAYFSILSQIFMGNVMVDAKRKALSQDLLKTTVTFLNQGFESRRSDDVLNNEDMELVSNAFGGLHALENALDGHQPWMEYTAWSLYCALVFILSSCLFDKKKPLKLLEELTKCGHRLPAADETTKDEQVKVLISCALSVPENVQHKSKALCLMVFSNLLPILRFDDLSPLFARLRSYPDDQEDNCSSEEESDEDFPLDQPSKVNGADDLMELDEKVIDITELEDLDVTDGLMDALFHRSSKHERGDESEQIAWRRYAPLELVRLFVTKGTNSVALLRALVELLKVAFLWASNGVTVNDNVLFARCFRCLHEIRKRKLSLADPASTQEASDVICAAIKTIFELSTSMPTLNRRKAALDDQLTKSLLYLLNQGQSLRRADLKQNHELMVRELSESLLLEQCRISKNDSRVVSERLGAACFHALPVLARSAMEDDCDPHKRIQYLRVCISVLSNTHSLAYLTKPQAKDLWASFCEELKKGFFLFHDVVFPSANESKDAAPWDANYFLTLMELLLQLSKAARRVDLAALVDDEFLLRLRHFNRPKFWSRPQAKKIKSRMRSCYPLGEHKFLADLYRALRSGSSRFEGLKTRNKTK